MKTHKSKLILLLLIAIAGSFLLVPGEQEQALIFLKDRQYERAEKLYKVLQADNNVDRNNLTPLTQIFLARGDVVSATQLYEEYLRQNLDDIEAWKKLFQLYRDTLKPYELMDALEQVVVNHPEVKYYEELIHLYKEYDVNDRRLFVALEKIVELDSEREEDSKNLILALAKKGEFDAASNRLDQYAERFPGKINQHLAELRLRLLLSAGRKNDAFVWAEQWLEKRQDLSIRYMALLYSDGINGDLDAALASADVVESMEMPAWLIDMFMKQDWMGLKQSALEKFVAQLGEEKLQDYPVIMVNLAIKQKNKIAIKKWLTLAESKTDLSAQQQANLMMTYFRLGKLPEAMSLLSRLAQQTEIPSKLLAESVMLIMKTNRINEGVAIFQSLRARRKVENNSDDRIIDEAWALLASAAGETQKVSQWLDSQSDKAPSVGVLTNLYFAAADQSHFRLASFIGRYLHSRTQTNADAQLITAALQGMKKRTVEEHNELVELLDAQLQASDLLRKERRELAFQLLRIGEKQAAIQQFQWLAEAKGPQGSDVKQLLFLWGKTPASAALDWLQERASNAADNELSSWWQYLIQAGGAERVIEMSASIKNISIGAEGVLVDALVTTGDFSGLDKRLQMLANKTESKARLESLAKYASRAGLSKTEEVIWQKVSSVQPMNTKAMRELGVAAFERGDLLAAGGYLSQFLSLTEGDWEAALYFGDVSLAYGRESDAKLNYKKSLRLLEKGLGESKQKDIARAHLLYQLGKTKEAMMAYDKLMVIYPDEFELRAKYSDLLINEGQLEKARLLLVGK